MTLMHFIISIAKISNKCPAFGPSLSNTTLVFWKNFPTDKLVVRICCYAANVDQVSTWVVDIKTNARIIILLKAKLVPKTCNNSVYNLCNIFRHGIF